MFSKKMIFETSIFGQKMAHESIFEYENQIQAVFLLGIDIFNN